jgi:hypothetical protein
MLSILHSMRGDSIRALEYYFKLWKLAPWYLSASPMHHAVHDALKANVPNDMLKSIVGLSVQTPQTMHVVTPRDAKPKIPNLTLWWDLSVSLGR